MLVANLRHLPIKSHATKLQWRSSGAAEKIHLSGTSSILGSAKKIFSFVNIKPNEHSFAAPC